MQEVLSIEDAFGDLRDPRSRASAHDLKEMLVVALCAILLGADSLGPPCSWTGCGATCRWSTALRRMTRLGV